jgi:hypothetical protein
MAESPRGKSSDASRAWRRLWEAVRPADDADHPIDLPTLGEYAALLQLNGRGAANSAFPLVAQHLANGCCACEADLQEIEAALAADDPKP